MTVNVSKPALNVREKLAELDKPTGIAGEAMLRAETPQEQFNLIGAGRRNVIINGNFQVSQRGDYSSATAVTHNTYTLDRWKTVLQAQTTTPTVNVTHSGNRLRMTATSSGVDARFGINQIIEVEDWMMNKWWTLSAIVKSNTSNCSIFTSSSAGIGGVSKLHSGNGQDELLTTTFYIPDGITIFRVFLRIHNPDLLMLPNINNGDYIEVTQVQLELGKVATPFEHRSYGEELALCQRYYYRVSTDSISGSMAVGFATSATGARGTIKFPVTMRVPPTGIEHTGSAANYKVAYAATAATCSSVPTFANATNDMAGVQFTVASGLTAGHGIVIERNNGTAYIGFTGAEL